MTTLEKPKVEKSRHTQKKIVSITPIATNIIKQHIILNLHTHMIHGERERERERERLDLAGIFRDAVAAVIHLTHQHLHRKVAGFGLLEGVLEPPPRAIRHHSRQRRTAALPLAVASAAAALHLLSL